MVLLCLRYETGAAMAAMQEERPGQEEAVVSSTSIWRTLLKRCPKKKRLAATR